MKNVKVVEYEIGYSYEPVKIVCATQEEYTSALAKMVRDGARSTMRVLSACIGDDGSQVALERIDWEKETRYVIYRKPKGADGCESMVSTYFSLADVEAAIKRLPKTWSGVENIYVIYLYKDGEMARKYVPIEKC